MSPTTYIQSLVEELDYIVSEVHVVLRVLVAVDRHHEEDPILLHAYPVLHGLIGSHMEKAACCLSQAAGSQIAR